MKIQILIIAAALAATGCATTSPKLTVESEHFRPRTEQIEEVVFKTKGPPGQSFVANLLIDGEPHEFSGTSPAEIPLKGCVIVGDIQKTKGPGTLSFEIHNVDQKRVASFGGLKSPGSICRFGYHDGGIEVVKK